MHTYRLRSPVRRRRLRLRIRFRRRIRVAGPRGSPCEASWTSPPYLVTGNAWICEIMDEFATPSDRECMDLWNHRRVHYTSRQEIHGFVKSWTSPPLWYLNTRIHAFVKAAIGIPRPFSEKNKDLDLHLSKCIVLFSESTEMAEWLRL